MTESYNVTYEVLPFKKAFDGAVAEVPLNAHLAITSTSAIAKKNLSTIDRAEQAIQAGRSDVVAHIAARSIDSMSEFEEVMERIDEAHVTDLFIVGGDIDMEEAGVFPDGLSLLCAIQSSGKTFRSVGVPAYPRGHHNPAVDKMLEMDMHKKRHILRQITDDPYQETQFDFSPSIIGGWLDEQAQDPEALPVQIGLFGAVGFEKGFRAMMLNGGIAEANKFMAKTGLTKFGFMRGHHITQTQSVVDSVLDAKPENVRGFTVNTLNEVAKSVRAFNLY